MKKSHYMYKFGPTIKTFAAPGPDHPRFDGAVVDQTMCAMKGCKDRPACSYSEQEYTTFCCRLCYETKGKQHHLGCDKHKLVAQYRLEQYMESIRA